MHKCFLCGKGGQFFELMKLKNMPSSAQNLPDEKTLSLDKGENLTLVQCKRCGLIQFACKPVSYYKNVIRAGGSTSTMRELRRKQYQELIETYDLNNKKILEVGSGRGEFLQFLNEFDVKAYGIENDDKLIEYAQKKGLNVFKGFADGNLGILSEGPFDAFLSFNFLEHQPNPNEMLSDIYDNLTDDGCGIITVPSFEYILENDGYYELIKDHLVYYTFETLELLLNNNGFVCVKKEIINRDTLSVIVKKREKCDVESLYNNTTKLNDSIQHIIEKYKNGKIAIWGASHQGFTLAATSKLGNKIEYIIDSSDFKQGKYSPASHIKIVSPDYWISNPTEAIIIIAPGYTDEIYKIIRSKYGQNVDVYCLKSNSLEMLK